MFKFNRQRVEENTRKAATEDLIGRVTAFRAGMEPEAIDIIEAELRRRGIDRAELDRQQQFLAERALFQPEGFAYKCSFCERPAIVREWGWHWLWGKIPLIPRLLNRCEIHAPAAAE